MEPQASMGAGQAGAGVVDRDAVAPTDAAARSDLDLGVLRPKRRLSSAATWTLFAAVAVTIFTDEIGSTTTPLFVDELTGRVMDLTAVFIMSQVAATIVALVAGPIIDRFDHRRLLLTVDAIAGIALAVSAFAAWKPDDPLDPLWTVYFAMFMLGGAGALYTATLEAALPGVVELRHLARANSLIVTTGEIAALIGPALAGILAATIGFWAGYASNTLGALFALAVFWTMRHAFRSREGDRPDPAPESVASRARTDLPARLRAGYRFLLRDRLLKWSLLAALLANITAGFLIPTMPVLVRELIGIESLTGIGFAYSALGVGGVVGGLVAGIVGGRIDSGKLLVVAFGSLALMLALIWASLGTIYGLIGLGTLSAAGVLASVHIRTLRQERPPDSLIGRVIAAFQGVSMAAHLVGAFVGGWLVTVLSSYRQALGWYVAVNIVVAVLLAMSPLRTEANGANADAT